MELEASNLLSGQPILISPPLPLIRKQHESGESGQGFKVTSYATKSK